MVTRRGRGKTACPATLDRLVGRPSTSAFQAMLHCGVYSVLMDAEYPIGMPGVELPVGGRGERRAALTEQARGATGGSVRLISGARAVPGSRESLAR